jgi:regulatory protein
MGFGAPSVKGRALRYLAQREHSRAELERKLARHVEDTPEAPAAEQIARALDELSARGLQSEARTAESVATRHGAKFGARRLKQTLQSKGLPAELVAQTVQKAQSTELERAYEVWKRRYGEPAPDAAGRARQARFLTARGFSTEVVIRIVKGLVDPD